MKFRLPVFFLMVLAASFLPVSSLKASEIASSGPIRKLQRGFLNIALSPVEITDKVVESQKYYTALPTWIAGLGKGSFYAVTRCVVGAFEILTAPVPLPANYQPVMQPEFVWDYFTARDAEPAQVDIHAL